MHKLARRRIELAVDATAKALGLYVRRISRQPEYNLLGLPTRGINTVIDVGANAGQFARKALVQFPKARLVCFEPLQLPFDKLQSWAKKYGDQITCVQAAIGAESGSIEMFEHLDHSPSSSILQTTDVTKLPSGRSPNQVKRTVKLLKLDDCVRGLCGIRQPILMKIDVQGYEVDVCKGAEHMLTVADSVIIEISMQEIYVGQPSFYDIAQLMHSYDLHITGMITQVLDEKNVPIYMDALFQRRRASIHQSYGEAFDTRLRENNSPHQRPAEET